MKSTTLIIGASENPDRVSNTAIHKLQAHGYDVKAVGLKPGKVGNIVIQTGMPEFKEIDTVSLYINPVVQEQYYGYIISLKPARVIFNPGTENPAFKKMLNKAAIKTEEACTLVMLSLGSY